MEKILHKILAIIAKITIERYKPIVIGITGSVGKSSTKEAVYSVLKHKFRARRSPKNYNNEIGVPLTILGEKSPGKNLIKWLILFCRSIRKIFFVKNYPEVLVLEMAADKPGDIKYLVNIVKPSRGIITAVSPAHTQFLGNVEGVLKEKQNMVTNLDYSAWAILNGDDENIKKIKNKVHCKVITYGLSENIDVSAIQANFRQELEDKQVKIKGLGFKINYNGSVVPVFLSRAVTNARVYSTLAAMAIGITFDMNLIKMAKYLSEDRILPGRMNPVCGIKSSLILDDTYNASPRALDFALKSLDEIKKHPDSKKWVVIGDMKELGLRSEEIHYNFGKKISKMGFDRLVCVGPEAKSLAKGARASVMNKENIFEFEDSLNAAEFIKGKIEEGDVLLVKGSQAVRMEKIVEKIMKYPEKKESLLVRQTKRWKEL